MTGHQMRNELCIRLCPLESLHVIECNEHTWAALRLSLNEIEAGLVVVELYVGPVDAFTRVLILFDFEDVQVEVALQLLVGKVDEQLLKAVLQWVGGSRDGLTGCGTLSALAYWARQQVSMRGKGICAEHKVSILGKSG